MGLPRRLGVKNSPANVEGLGSIPGLGRLTGGENGSPFQYSCWENPMNRGVWQAAVHKVAKSWTRLSRHATFWYSIVSYHEDQISYRKYSENFKNIMEICLPPHSFSCLIDKFTYLIHQWIVFHSAQKFQMYLWQSGNLLFIMLFREFHCK